MTAYAKKLLDPRWQRLAALVKERAGWKCQRCGADDKNLHAHHHCYLKDLEPWEYPAYELECLCWECHKKIEHRLRIVRAIVSRFTFDEQDRLISELLQGDWKRAPLAPESELELETSVNAMD